MMNVVVKKELVDIVKHRGRGQRGGREKGARLLLRFSLNHAVLVTALLDRPIQMMQLAPDRLEVWNEIRTWYMATTIANRNLVLMNIMHIFYLLEEDMSDSITEMEKNLKNWILLNLDLPKELEVLLLLISWSFEKAMSRTGVALK